MFLSLKLSFKFSFMVGEIPWFTRWWEDTYVQAWLAPVRYSAECARSTVASYGTSSNFFPPLSWSMKKQEGWLGLLLRAEPNRASPSLYINAQVLHFHINVLSILHIWAKLFSAKEEKRRARKPVQWVKVPDAKPEGASLIPGIHMAEGGNRLLGTHTHLHTHALNAKNKNIKRREELKIQGWKREEKQKQREKKSQAWWHTPVTPTLGKPGERKLEVSLGYRARLCLKKKKWTVSYQTRGD